MSPRPPSSNAGLSLLEILLVSAILLVLAGVAVPVLTMTVEDARDTSCEQQLQRVRTAIDYYKFQHLELNPGYDPELDEWTLDAFLAQLLTASDQAGFTAAVGSVGYPFGPYLTEGIPANPYNDLDTILFLEPGRSGAGLPDDSTGWVYDADDGSFRANSSGLTQDGKPIYEL